MENSFKLFDPLKDSSSVLPNLPGNYLIVLRTSSELPKIKITPTFRTIKYGDKEYEVVYTGISTIGIKIRDYRQHFTGNNAGRSTLRKSLGSLMGLTKIPRDINKPENNKTKFYEAEEEMLSSWMIENLLLLYCTGNNIEQIEDLEKELINIYNPPLNIKNNHQVINKDYRALLKALRHKK